MLQNIWNSISNNGLNEDSSSEQVRNYHLFNRLNFFTILIIWAYMPNMFLQGIYWMVAVQFSTGVLCMTVFFITRHGNFASAVSILTIILMGYVSFQSLMANNVLLEIQFIPISVIPFVLIKNKKVPFILFFTVIACYFTVEYLNDIITPYFSYDAHTIAFKQVFNICILFFCVFILIFHFKVTNDYYENVLIKNQSVIKEKNVEVTASINYAKRIQSAILPSEAAMQKFLPTAFVIYMPKDIVAGDFYWVKEVNQKILFAVADCTGHGVPGAFVSMICSNALNRAVNEFEEYDPAGILNRVKKIVVDSFNDSDEDIRDGMDIAICALDQKTLELEFSGANNSLFIFSKDEGEVSEYKGHRQPIGKFYYEEEFQNQKFQLKKADAVYLFSDGFTDQFGGDSSRKLMKKNFKALIQKHSNEDIHKQKDLLTDEFIAWKGDIEQVDDVCVLGFKI